MVVHPNGTRYEPSVWEIDDTEKTPKEIIGNWFCAVIATGVIIVLIPFFLLILGLLIWRGDAEMVSSSTKSSLSGM